MKRAQKALSSSALALSLFTLMAPIAHATNIGNNGDGFGLSWLGLLGLLSLLEL